MTASVYRYFDVDGRLLYVGRTHLVASRFEPGEWWDQVVKVETTFCADIPAAIQIIREAIQKESPLHNKYVPRAIKAVAPYLLGKKKQDPQLAEKYEKYSALSKLAASEQYKQPFKVKALESDAVGYMPDDLPLHVSIDWDLVDAALYDSVANAAARRYDERGTFGYGSARAEFFKQHDPWAVIPEYA